MNNDSPSSTTTSKKEAVLPFSKAKPFLFGALYALCMRILDGTLSLVANKLPKLTNFSDVSFLVPMSAAFVLGVPFAVGALTIYYAEKIKPRSFAYYFGAPWVSVFFFLIGVAALYIEGSICIAMAAPIFCLVGSAGGLLAGLVCRLLKQPPRTLQSIALLPILLLFFEPSPASVVKIHKVTVEKYIASSPAVVWHHINNADNIKLSEVPNSMAYFIGAPKPLSGKTIYTEQGFVRKVVWERGVQFDEIITHWDENSFIEWNYKFSPTSFPEGAMDQHVEIGGEYFDLLTTSYRLTPENGGTRLTMTINYRISTAFNWYAEPLAHYLITDTANSLLSFYKGRSE